jgi:hypothetical protein
LKPATINPTSKQTNATFMQNTHCHRPKKASQKRTGFPKQSNKSWGSKHRARNKPTNRPQPSKQQARKHLAE